MKNKQLLLLSAINLIIVSACLILNDMYISLVELILIVISFSLFVIILETLKIKLKLGLKLIVSAVYFSLLVLCDLTVDYFTFSVFYNVVEDGKRLSLMQTIGEFKDDAFLLLLILLTLYLIASVINSLFRQKKKII